MCEKIYVDMLNELIYKKLHAPYTLNLVVLQSPKRPRKTIILLHGIGSSTMMWNGVATDLTSDVRIIAIDLLGFGNSPNPGWATYDARTQANCIVKTLILHRIPLKSMIVGHSLGALVAVELARRFPWYISDILLVSPPIYRPSKKRIVATQKEDLLRGMYKILYRNPRNTERALLLAKRFYIKRTGVTVASGVNVESFLAALRAAIINQSTIDHINDVRAPIHILSGSRDPLVVPRNLKELAMTNQSITHTVIKKAGHNVVGVMLHAVSNEITKHIR